MQFFYHSSAYRSFRRVAIAQRDMIAEVCTLTSNPEEADLVFLHCEPFQYMAIYAKHPYLRNKYVIGCAMWESDRLPESYAAGIRLVNEVWTASDYCADAFRPHNEQVFVVPHLVARDVRFTTQEQESVRRSLDFNNQRLYLLMITRIRDPRKNVKTLLEAFAAISSQLSDVSLVLKGDSQDQPLGHHCKSVITIAEDFTDGQINALYDCVSVYVSSHHAEGWGLTLSDAIVHDIPVVATGYSGNCTFMTPKASYLVPAKLDYIDPSDCFGPFSSDMKWGYPQLEELSALMTEAVQDVREGKTDSKTTAAKLYTQQFSRPAVCAVISTRLRHIAAHLGSKEISDAH